MLALGSLNETGACLSLKPANDGFAGQGLYAPAHPSGRAWRIVRAFFAENFCEICASCGT
jgi:hypothetical protein